MAMVNRVDLTRAGAALAQWLQSTGEVGTNVQVSDIASPAGTGLSHEILTFDADASFGDGNTTLRLVARVAPGGEALFADYDLQREYRLMRALDANSPIPVARAIGMSEDPTIVGGDFLVMERVDGQVPGDDPPYTVSGWIQELDDAGRAKLYDNALSMMTQIHALNWEGLELGFLDRPPYGEPGLSQQLGWIDEFADHALRGRNHPIFGAAREWLQDNRPAGTPPLVLSWGDARPGNMLFGDDLQVTAVLDWELAALREREQDVGFWLFHQRFQTEGIGAPLPGGFLDRQRMVDRYEAITGYQLRDLDYYEVLAAVLFALAMVRFTDLMVAGGILPPDSEMWLSNPVTQMIAATLGLPAPGGTSTSFIGQRG